MSDSGVHGQRGYGCDVVFNWLGATTPLPAKTHRMMYQLGTRLLFFETPSQQPTEEELTAYAERDDSANAECECQAVVNAFAIDFFTRHPVGSVEPKSVVVSKEMARSLTRYATLLSYGRREVRYSDGDWGSEPTVASEPEGPYKIVNYFKELARAHALIHGRNVVTDADLDMVASIAVSSIPKHLRHIVRELQRNGSVTSSHYAKLRAICAPTARCHLEELALTEIGVLKKGTPATNEPDTLTLAPSFSWLYRAPLNTKCSACAGEEEMTLDRGHLAFKLPSGTSSNEGRSQVLEGQSIGTAG